MLEDSFCRQVARSFDRAASKYHMYADMQYRIAKRLSDMIKVADNSPKILDIGCGPGYIAQFLSCSIFQLDIAFKMCQAAQRNSNGMAINGDMHHLPVQSYCIDIVTASMSLHWSADLPQTLGEIHRILAAGGKLYCTMPVDHTFHELNDILQLLHLPKIEFLLMDDIIALLQNNNFTVRTNIDRMSITYPSLLDLIKFMKNTGSNISKNKPFLTKELLHKIEQLYKKMFAYDNQIQVSWDIAYIVASK